MGGVSLVKWLPWWLSGKESACQCRSADLIPGLQRSPRKGTCSNILAWEIPWTEEPGGVQSTGSQRVRHDLATKQQVSLYNSYLEIIQFASKGHMGEKLFSDCYLQT